MLFGVIGWIVVGLIVGFIVSKSLNLRGDDPRLGIGVAVAGAIVGGILYAVVSGVEVTAWNPWSLLFAAVGGGVGAAVWHVVRSRYASKEDYSTRRSY